MGGRFLHWQGAPWGRALAALAVAGLVALGWRTYGWSGLALGLGALCMWTLLHMSRVLAVLRRTAAHPVGSVANVVMLHSRLRAGMPLLQVLALTQALGQRLEADDASFEVYQWSDAGGDLVRCTFDRGKLVAWHLQRS